MAALPSARPRVRAPRVELVEPCRDNGEARLCLGVVEADQELAGLDPIAHTHRKCGNDAAAQMLHLLHMALDHEDAARSPRRRSK